MASDPSTISRQSPLHERHVSLGAKLADFSGWQMPISYSGVVEEHTAVRTAVGLFDVSHLGKARVAGPGAAALVNAAMTNDLSRIGPGRAQYTLCCDDDGGVVDDLIAYLRSDDDVFLIPNAANGAQVVARLTAAAPAGVTVANLHDDVAVLAVQGPRSPEVLGALGLPHDLAYMAFTDGHHAGVPVTVCRSGYTGEHGYELLVASAGAPGLWDAALAAVRSCGGTVCGLGARDTLRTEMGYPLHGHELSADISPVQAGCGWAVGWDKPAFWGRSALLAERAAGPRRRLWGLRLLERGVPRAHMDVLDETGMTIGQTTSGTFSPTLRTGIALALLAPEVTAGRRVALDVRGRTLAAEVIRPPFVEAHVR